MSSVRLSAAGLVHRRSRRAYGSFHRPTLDRSLRKQLKNRPLQRSNPIPSNRAQNAACPLLIPDRCSGDSSASQISSIISDCERRANVHGALRSLDLSGRFRLFEKMNSSFVAVVRDEIRRFLEAHPAQRTAHVHIPRSRRVLGLFAQSISHVLSQRRTEVKKSLPTWGPSRFRSERNCEIHLPFEGVDSGDEDGYLVADLKAFARASANELPSSGFKQIEVVRQRGDMDKARDKSVWQFHHQPVIADIDNRGPKNLRIALVELPLKKFELLHLRGVDLRIGCGSFGH